jgi:hypothetical protein
MVCAVHLNNEMLSFLLYRVNRQQALQKRIITRVSMLLFSFAMMAAFITL